MSRFSRLIQRRRPSDPLTTAAIGALTASAVVLAWAVWRWAEGEQFGELWAYTSELIQAVIVAVLLIAPHGFKQEKPQNLASDVALLSTPVVAAGLLSLPLLRSWRDAYLLNGTRQGMQVLTISVLLLAGIGSTLLMARKIRTVRRPLSTGQPKASSPPRRRRWALTLLVACAPALAVALAIATVGAALPSPTLSIHAKQTLADAVSEDNLLTTPTGAPTETAWHTTIMGDTRTLAISSGVRGPILMTNNGLTALDGNDGSVLWTYNSPDQPYIRAPESSETGWPFLMVSSPDHRHVAFALHISDPRFKNASATTIVILDTMTGKTTATYQFPQNDADTDGPLPFRDGPLQLTDSAALIGTDVIALNSGKLLGRLPSDVIVSDDEDQYTGTAGHSTFILGSTDSASSRLSPLTLVPDSDLSARVPLDHACSDPFDHRIQLVIQDGWVATCSGQEAPRGEQQVWSVYAINIDEVAAAGDASAVEQIPMGEGLGMNSVASAAANTLITIPVRPLDERTMGRYGTPRSSKDPPWAGTVLDPSARTSIPAEQSPSIGAATFTYSEPSYDTSGVGYELTVTPQGGSAPLTLPMTTTEVLDQWMDADADQPHGLVRNESFDEDDLRLLSAPGCILLIFTSNDRMVDPPTDEITIVAVR